MARRCCRTLIPVTTFVSCGHEDGPTGPPGLPPPSVEPWGDAEATLEGAMEGEGRGVAYIRGDPCHGVVGDEKPMRSALEAERGEVALG